MKKVYALERLDNRRHILGFFEERAEAEKVERELFRISTNPNSVYSVIEYDVYDNHKDYLDHLFEVNHE